MKKTIIAAIAVALCGMTASAQNHLTVKVGPTFTHPTTNSDILKFKTGAGVQFGASYSFDLGHHLFFEPGLAVAYNTYSPNDYFKSIVIGDMVPELVNFKFKEWDMNVPLHIGYTIPVGSSFGIRIFTGPQFTIGLSNKFQTKAYIGGNPITSDINAYSDEIGYNRFIFHWNVGAGFALPYNLKLDFTASLACTNLVKDGGGASIKRHTYAVTLGYSF